MKKLFLPIAVSLGAVALSSAAETRFESGAQQAALIELYTSEGCSSCPPAEAWLSRLKDQPGLWKRFVPVAFHVDYWNHLGWRDRFSSQQFTERQRRYAAKWQSESVYTPAVVLNGNESQNWSSADPTGRPNEKQIGILSATTTDGRTFAIEFRPQNGNAGDWQAHIALLGSGISVKIGAGENRGRNLQHDFVALDLQDALLKNEAATARASLTIHSPAERGARQAVAIWVSRRDEVAPMQATGGWLP